MILCTIYRLLTQWICLKNQLCSFVEESQNIRRLLPLQMTKRKTSIQIFELNEDCDPIKTPSIPIVAAPSAPNRQSKTSLDADHQKQNVSPYRCPFPFEQLRMEMINKTTFSRTSSSLSSSSSSSSSSESSNCSVISPIRRNFFQRQQSAQKLRAITLPIKYQPQRSPLVRIHHNSMTKYSQIQKKPTSLNTNKFNNLNPTLCIRTCEQKELKTSHVKLLSVEGKHFCPDYSAFSGKEESQFSKTQHTQFQRGYSPLQQQKKGLKDEKKMLELAGKAKQKVKRNQFFKLPKEKERILDLQLRQKILSDMESKQLRERLEKAEKRSGSCSMQRVKKIAQDRGVKLARVQNIAKRTFQKKYDADMAAFKTKINPKPKNRLIIR